MTIKRMIKQLIAKKKANHRTQVYDLEEEEFEKERRPLKYMFETVYRNY